MSSSKVPAHRLTGSKVPEGFSTDVGRALCVWFSPSLIGALPDAFGLRRASVCVREEV